MNTQITETEVTEIASYFGNELYSPYALAKVYNEILKDAGIDKILPPQMIYIYTSATKKYIKAEGEGKGRKVAKADAIEWIEKYIVKQLAKADKEAELVSE